MKAVILAAGRGSRMRGITDQKPKCLTRVGGRPLIDWQMRALTLGGVAEVAVVTGYRSESLQSLNIRHFHNNRWADTNMVRSLMCADAWLKSGAIVSYADLIYTPDIVQSLFDAEGDIVISYDTEWLTQWRLRFDNPLLDAETFRVSESGKLIEIGQRAESTDDIQGQYMGLTRFSPTGWKKVADFLAGVSADVLDKLDVTALLSLLIERGFSISTVPIAGNWFEIDDERDLKACDQEIDRGRLNFRAMWD